MDQKNEQFNDSNLQLPKGLINDLKAIYKSGETIKPQADYKVIAAANKHLTRRIKRKVLHYLVPAAAAAVIFLAVILNTSDITESPQMAFTITDIDRNGTVNITDALKLAKHIQSQLPADIKYDLNKDGIVDKRDIDIVAFEAVKLHKGA